MRWVLINKEGERGPPSCLEHILTRGLLNWGPLKIGAPPFLCCYGLGLVFFGRPSPFYSCDFQVSDLGIQSCRALLWSWKAGSTL